MEGSVVVNKEIKRKFCILCHGSSQISNKKEEYIKVLLAYLSIPPQQWNSKTHSQILNFCAPCIERLDDILTLKNKVELIEKTIKNKVADIQCTILKNYVVCTDTDVNKFREIAIKDLLPVVRLDKHNALIRRKRKLEINTTVSEEPPSKQSRSGSENDQSPPVEPTTDYQNEIPVISKPEEELSPQSVDESQLIENKKDVGNQLAPPCLDDSILIVTEPPDFDLSQCNIYFENYKDMYKCAYCATILKADSNLTALTRHINVIHASNSRFKCAICLAMFFSYKKCRSHIGEFHCELFNGRQTTKKQIKSIVETAVLATKPPNKEQPSSRHSLLVKNVSAVISRKRRTELSKNVMKRLKHKVAERLKSPKSKAAEQGNKLASKTNEQTIEMAKLCEPSHLNISQIETISEQDFLTESQLEIDNVPAQIPDYSNEMIQSEVIKIESFPLNCNFVEEPVKFEPWNQENLKADDIKIEEAAWTSPEIYDSIVPPPADERMWTKPPLSIAQMCILSIMDLGNKNMYTSSTNMVAFILDNFPYYKTDTTNWMERLFVVLSRNVAFQKVEENSVPVSQALWTLNSEILSDKFRREFVGDLETINCEATMKFPERLGSFIESMLTRELRLNIGDPMECSTSNGTKRCKPPFTYPQLAFIALCNISSDRLGATRANIIKFVKDTFPYFDGILLDKEWTDEMMTQVATSEYKCFKKTKKEWIGTARNSRWYWFVNRKETANIEWDIQKVIELSSTAAYWSLGIPESFDRIYRKYGKKKYYDFTCIKNFILESPVTQQTIQNGVIATGGLPKHTEITIE